MSRAPRASTRKPDVEVSFHGSIILFSLLTPAARTWVNENVCDPLYVGRSLACEPRYATNLAEGMAADGLRLRPCPVLQ